MKTNRAAALVILTHFAAVAIFFLTACTPDARKATLTATEHALAGDALLTVETVAHEAIQGGKVDFVHAAADALWRNGAGDIASVVNAATAGKVPDVADVAAQTVLDVAKSGALTKQEAASAVAAALSAVAQSAK